MLDKPLPDRRDASLFELATGVVRSSWKLILSVAMLAGITAFAAITFLVPSKYVSVAYLSASDPDIEGAWKAPKVLDAVLKGRFDPGISIDEAREDLLEKIRWTKMRTVSSGAQAKAVYRIELISKAPQRAQELNNALLAALVELTKPGPIHAKRIDEDLAMLRPNLDDVSRSIRAIETTLPSGGGSETLGKLYELRNAYETRIVSLTRARDGITDDAILSKPTLPTQPEPKMRTVLSLTAAAFSAMLAGFVLLIRRLGREA